MEDELELKDLGAILGLFAHDLRNPLSALRSNLGYVSSAPGMDEDAREALEDSAVSCDTLLSIIDNIDVLGRGVRGEQLAKDGVSAATLLADVQARHAALAKSHAVGLVVDPVPRDQSPWLDVNAGSVATALSNMLRNAVQHAGSSGNVRVSLAVAGDQCVISVQDSGAPIPPDSVTSALSLVGQLRAKRDGRSRYSYGLGLYSARRAAELGGAALRVGTAESGSVLELVLPIGGG